MESRPSKNSLNRYSTSRPLVRYTGILWQTEETKPWKTDNSKIKTSEYSNLGSWENLLLILLIGWNPAQVDRQFIAKKIQGLYTGPNLPGCAGFLLLTVCLTLWKSWFSGVYFMMHEIAATICSDSLSVSSFSSGCLSMKKTHQKANNKDPTLSPGAGTSFFVLPCV